MHSPHTQLLFGIALLAFLGAPFAQSCETSIEKYLEIGEVYSHSSIEGGYLLFAVDGKYSMLAKCDAEQAYLTKEEDIANVLSSYAGKTQGMPDASWKANMSSLLSSFSSSRGKEAECKRYTGIDRFPCHDRLSCSESCYTPMCSDLKHSRCEIGGSGCEFIDGIVYFSGNTTTLDNGTALLNALFAGIEQADGPLPVERGIQAVDRMLASCESINNNILMRTYEEKGYYFCPRVPYDSASLQKIKTELSIVKDRFILVSNPSVTAKFISEETARRQEKLSNNGWCKEQINYTKKALAQKPSSPVENYSEVRGIKEKMQAIATVIEGKCNSKDFSSAKRARDEFGTVETQAQEALANLTSEYNSVKQLESEVLAKLSALPPDANATSVFESMKLVERELPIVTSASDLAVLKGVLLGNKKQVEELASPNAGAVDWLVLPLAGAALITIVLFIVMKKTRKEGL
jgi:hypothetical protein